MSLKWTIYRYDVTAERAGSRLDIFLAGQSDSLSRTQIKKIIDLGGVHVNGRRVRSCSAAMQLNDHVEIYLDHLPLEPFRLSEPDVLYQDKDLIAINKPAHLDTQPTHARFKGTLYEALQVYLQDPFRPMKKPDLGMIQRLDRGTSGVIVFSIHPRAHKKMTSMFVTHNVEKRYLALVKGVPVPDHAEIRSSLARTRRENKVVSVSKGGKEAITRYRVIETFPQASLVELELLTGRSHQIRAHMSEHGHPLIGDKRYGGPLVLGHIRLERPLLHAEHISFRHPVSGEMLDFSAAVPTDMTQLLENLRKANDDLSTD